MAVSGVAAADSPDVLTRAEFDSLRSEATPLDLWAFQQEAHVQALEHAHDLLADYEPTDEELAAQRSAELDCAAVDAEFEITKTLGESAQFYAAELLDQATDAMIAGGYTVALDFEANGYPSFAFNLSPYEALQAAAWRLAETHPKRGSAKLGWLLSRRQTRVSRRSSGGRRLRRRGSARGGCSPGRPGEPEPHHIAGGRS